MVKKLVVLILTILLSALALAAAGDGPPAMTPEESAKVQAVVVKMSEVQKDLRSLRVNFVQTNQFQMLKDPQVLKGQLLLEKPDRALYRYTSPSPLVFLIKEGTLLVYDPKQKQAFVQDIRRHQDRIFRYLGVGQPMDELVKHFTVIWVDEKDGVAHVQLVPLKSRVKRKLATLHFWVDIKTGLPSAFEVVEPEGDRIRFDFRDWEVNPDLGPKAFEVTIPNGVKVQRQLSDLTDPFKPSGE